MSEALADQLRATGWTAIDDGGFIDLVGPLWYRQQDGAYEYAIVGQEKHRNRRGVVQGGLLMTLADRTCGMTGRFVSGVSSLATVQFGMQFVDGAKIGELLVSKPRVIRSTRSLIFMATDIIADDRVLASATGVFKVMKGNDVAEYFE